VGGLGTRLRTVVSSAPKVLASVGENSFLQLLVKQLRYQGIRRLVMCTGYLAEQVEHAFGDGQAWDVEIEYSKEERPLGTAGAVKNADHYLLGEKDFFVMNGDSFLEVDFEKLMTYHRNRNAVATMAVRHVSDAARYGTVRVNSEGRVESFDEKCGLAAPGVVNGGVYVFSQRVLPQIPARSGSLEKDVFPQLLKNGVYALEQRGMFIDIGTPEDYARAQLLCDVLNQTASHLPS